MATRLPTDLERTCIDTLRLLAVDMVEAAQSGHPGLPLGAAHLAHGIFARLRHAPREPRWADRDRFVLSAGHGSALLYSMLHLTGYDLPMAELRRFRQLGSKTPGHPEAHVTPGVETTTGPLGQGFANGVGMALAERFLAERFNRPGHEIVNHRVYAIVSDGDLMEGLSSEAGSLAGHMKLGKLTYLYDSNRISIEGSTDLAFTENVGQRFESFGWHVLHCDGHDLGAIEAALDAAEKDARPSLIIARTHIGLDSELQDTAKVHGAALGAERTKKLKEKLGWPAESFHVPEAARAEYGKAVARGESLASSWKQRFEAYRAAHPELAAEFERAQRGELPEGALAALPTWPAGAQGLATRQASGKCLHALFPKMPELIGGSADLAESNLTTVEGYGALGLEPGGRIAHFGVREHAMGSMANGIALHGGARPYLGTFLVFTDYMRPAMRLAALQELPVVYVMTHDSIGLGEDGPTHQPIEQVASLRAIPRMTVIRPADANETSEAWAVALERSGPTVLALTRQKLPILDRPADASARRGAYVLKEAPGGTPDVILIATGSEVVIALEAAELLAKESGPAARVVSMPSWELFAEQDAAWREAVLPSAITARVAVEAGTTFGWERHVGLQGAVIGIDRFGASGKFEEVYEALGVTARAVADAARRVAGR